MYMIGLGIEVSPLNPFIKDYYSKLKGDELNEAEVNVLGNKQNLEKLVLSCEEKLNDKSIIESESYYKILLKIQSIKSIHKMKLLI